MNATEECKYAVLDKTKLHEKNTAIGMAHCKIFFISAMEAILLSDGNIDGVITYIQAVINEENPIWIMTIVDAYGKRPSCIKNLLKVISPADKTI